MLKKLSFRAKLLLVLFVPFLALVIVAAAGLSDRFAELHAQEQYGSLVAPLRSLQDVSRALQDEAVVSAWYVSADRPFATVPIAQARDRTNAAIAAYLEAQPAFADAASADQLYEITLLLRSVRAGFHSMSAPAGVAPGTPLLSVDSQLLGFGEGIARTITDRDIAARVTRAFGLLRAREELAREGNLIVAYLTGGNVAYADWVNAIAADNRYQSQFRGTALPAEVEAFDAGIATRPASTDLLRPLALDTPAPAALPARTASAQNYYAAYRQQAGALERGTRNVADLIAGASEASASAARNDVWVYGGIAVFAMLLTLLLIWFVTRAVVRPVRELTSAARDLSDRRLPELVESLRRGGDVSQLEPALVQVRSEDEIGELARAFNAVEAVTRDVAVEQSRLLRKGMGDLFVNLARRNQSLLERQLELLDQLERNEHNPAALDSLFKLDHMATRMRRNAESLLVLSGAEQPRQWQEPIALVDVVRAAASEIADFPRVELLGVDQQLAVAGRAVADLAHLLAELLENATSFSPPDTAVVVSGANTPSGYVLNIADQGIGMATERVKANNDLLRHPPVVGLALSRALGLHVVGLLAARHGIAVELRAANPKGTVALVLLPTAVLERVAAPVAPVREATPRAVPLTPRPTSALRPEDEPPVEQWRREGLATTVAVGSPVPPAPAPEARIPEPPPVVPPPAPEARVPEPPPVVPPPAPEARVPEPPPVVPPPAPEARVPEPPPVVPAPAPSPSPWSAGPGPDAPDARTELPAPDDFGPLPSRVPGNHLRHQPTPIPEPPAPSGDGAGEGAALRPYHVHEMLTRHQLGKRRAHEPEADAGAGNADAGHEREDGFA